MARKGKVLGILALVLVAGAAGGGYVWLQQRIQPMPAGAPTLLRFDKPTTLPVVLTDLGRRGIVRDPVATRLYASLRRSPTRINTGTYRVAPGMTADQLFRELQKPLQQMVRIPETNWARRTANLLEKKYNVAKADEYLALVRKPQEFAKEVSFPLPEDSLEGYLFPDTYDLPPLYGARNTIERQLKAFEDKVWDKYKPKDLRRTLIVASMVEMEAGTDEDRHMIAGVIENRIKKGMRLQIDATILYGMQKWRTLTFADYRNQKHDYNTYLIDGLPPGPICSPSAKSVAAALKPAKHDYVYYVALPDGTSIYASTYNEHLRNIQKRRKAVREQEKAAQ